MNSTQWRLAILTTCFTCWILVPGSGLGQVQFQKPTWQNIQSSSGRGLGSNPSVGGQEQAENTKASGSSSQFASDQTDVQDSNKSRTGFASNKSSRPQPIVTRQNVFGVPFSVKSDAEPIREVQLHVSTDQGSSWSLYSRQLPTAREFPFRANADGEYWFAVKTIGSTIADKKLTPQLIIAIDSKRPNFNVSLKTDALGRLVVGWRAADENLDANSIQLAYQPVSTWGRSGPNWQQVKLPRVERDIKKVYEDEIAFYADTSNVSLDLRISIADKAGNVAIVSRRYNLPRTAMKPTPNANQQINVAQRTSQNNRIANANVSPSSRPPSTDPYSAYSQKDKDDAATQVGLNAGFRPGHDATRKSGAGRSNSSGVASSSARPQGWQIQGNAGFQQDFSYNRPQENEWNNRTENAPNSVSDPGFQNPNRLASSGRSIVQPDEAFARGSNLNRIPSGQYAKLSSSRKFEMDYQVEHIQPDDISRLEIWVTENAGDTWKLHATDPDRQSPVTIEVADDGVYGYRVRVQTVDGLESSQPTKGDSADVWVEVDTTRPSVELTSIPYGRRSDAGKLIVNWRASDRRLAVKPITLYYSVNLDGPWQIIVEKLDNSGQFKWPVTDRIPRSVYLRIEAVDAAGNKNFHQTEQPIDLSGLNPRGMIRSVRPIK